MKILQVLHQFLPVNAGGVENYVNSLSRELVRSGNEVWILCGPGHVVWDPVIREHTYGQIPVCYVRNRPGGREGPLDFFKTFKNNTLPGIFDRVLSRIQPDIIHFHHTVYLSGNMIFQARQRRIPTVLTLHDFWFLCHKLHLVDWRGRPCGGPQTGAKCAFCLGSEYSGAERWAKTVFYLLPLLYRTRYQLRVLNAVDVSIIPALFMKDIVAPYSVHWENRTVHIPYGIPVRPNQARSSRPREGVRFGFLGSAKRHKGLHLLIEAFTSLKADKKPTLHVYGSYLEDAFPLQDASQRLARNRVFFHGPYDNHRVGEILHHIDVLVVPSVWRETGPMVILEAFASKKPVIASNLGGMQELVRHGKNGFLFEYGDVGALRDALELFMDEPSLVKCLNPNIDKVHTVESNARAVMDVYSRLL